MRKASDSPLKNLSDLADGDVTKVGGVLVLNKSPVYIKGSLDIVMI